MEQHKIVDIKRWKILHECLEASKKVRKLNGDVDFTEEQEKEFWYLGGIIDESDIIHITKENLRQLKNLENNKIESEISLKEFFKTHGIDPQTKQEGIIITDK